MFLNPMKRVTPFSIPRSKVLLKFCKASRKPSAFTGIEACLNSNAAFYRRDL